MALRLGRIVVIGLGAVVAVSAATSWGVATLTTRTDGDTGASAQERPGLTLGVPTILSAKELTDLGASVDPLYWLGERDGTQLEVTVVYDDTVFVRYLPQGVRAGASEEYLTVATYRVSAGHEGLREAIENEEAELLETRTGAVAATFSSHPASTYLTFPGAAFQVEVFSPTAGEARRLVENGSPVPAR
ncbi:MAG: hypothetical protein FWD18_01255 [Micrococcales bacterium]|nr:hypothetical protein [Micrococcales bacterium]